MLFNVRFDRYTQENGDDDIAAEKFPQTIDLAHRLFKQLREEINENKKLIAHCTAHAYSYRIINDNLFCAWIGFDWDGEGIDFCRELQRTYDDCGMSGFYEVLDVTGGDLPSKKTDVGNREILKEWFAEIN